MTTLPSVKNLAGDIGVFLSWQISDNFQILSKTLLICLILMDIHQYQVFDHAEYISGLQYAFNAFLCCFSEHFFQNLPYNWTPKPAQMHRNRFEIVIPEFSEKTRQSKFPKYAPNSSCFSNQKTMSVLSFPLIYRTGKQCI